MGAKQGAGFGIGGRLGKSYTSWVVTEREFQETVFNSENSETSFENKSPNSQNSVGQESRTKGLGNKGGKLCFVCYSPNHLIKNCNLHERTFQQTQTHKPKGTQGSRDTRPVWNNINRVNHSNFSGNSRYPHQKRSFTPSAVLTREGLKSTARPKMTRTVPSKSTANVFYQGTARPRIPHAVLSKSTGRPYYPRMDNIRPRTSSFSPSSRSSTTRTPYRPQRPKKIMKSIWVKKGSTVGSQAVLPQKVRVKGSVMINPKQTWRPKGTSLYSVIVDKDNCLNLKIQRCYVAFEMIIKEEESHAKVTIKTSIAYTMRKTSKWRAKFQSPFCFLNLWTEVIYPSGGVTCLVAKATKDEAVLWHRRLGHINFKNINKLVQGNLITRESLMASQEEGICWDTLLATRFLESKTENYAASEGNVSTHDDGLKIWIPAFTVHGSKHSAAHPMHLEESTADNEVSLSFDEQDLHDELVNLMHQESLVKLHHDAQRTAFEEEKKRIALAKEKECANSTFTLSTAKTPPQSTGNTPIDSDDDVPKDGVFTTNSFDDEHTDTEEDGAPDYNNMDHTIDVSSTPTHRIHKIHPQSQIIGKSTAGVQTRRKLKESTSNQHQALLSFIYKQNRTNHKDQQTCLFACFLSQEEPKKVSQALADESWVEAMQEELLQFKLQDVWVLCDLPDGKRVIGTKWVFRNKRDERGTIIKNKARLVAQGYRQEEGVDYDEVFAPVARIEAIRLFLAFASFMGFTVYQMDVKSAFLYGNITEEVYVKQPPGFEDPTHPNKVYRVVKALYGLHQAPRAWYERLSTFLLKHGYRRGAIDKTLFIKKDRRDIMLVQVYVDDIIFGSTKSSMVKDFEELMQKEFKMSSMGELTFFLGLQVKQSNAGIFLSQDKYVKDILNKFDFRTIKPASTPIEAHKSLGKDEEGDEVDVHLYRSMIGCLMYLTASRPDIMFAVCLLHDSSHSKGRRLVSGMQETTIVLYHLQRQNISSASCCAQVSFGCIDQLLELCFNFMNTEIHIDNESTICIVRNPVLHSKTKHIQIRHHFIRDCYEQRLINVVKVHTDDNVADLLTKGFDLARFNFLVVTIGMMNP
ncbi:putative ribonuclease H-like domain-containing protein [Tanacetum coccineum]|uniref:Ribonuclease H-like domain-containing protein n=1 Tax=Tanacetum coccineum TaxID=301880 RepID=A0ABQ5HMX8_9ASTR